MKHISNFKVRTVKEVVESVIMEHMFDMADEETFNSIKTKIGIGLSEIGIYMSTTTITMTPEGHVDGCVIYQENSDNPEFRVLNFLLTNSPIIRFDDPDER